MQHSVAVKKGSAPRILARNPCRVPVLEKRRVGEIFGHPPIQGQLSLAHQVAVSDNFFYPRMQLEFGWNIRKAFGQMLQFSQRQTGLDL
jgi:hypothetical protein